MTERDRRGEREKETVIERWLEFEVNASFCHEHKITMRLCGHEIEHKIKSILCACGVPYH